MCRRETDEVPVPTRRSTVNARRLSMMSGVRLLYRNGTGAALLLESCNREGKRSRTLLLSVRCRERLPTERSHSRASTPKPHFQKQRLSSKPSHDDSMVSVETWYTSQPPENDAGVKSPTLPVVGLT
jgi:hypothetical protein